MGPPALYKGSTRVRTVEVYVGDVLATTWTSSGTTDGFESIDLSGYSGRYLTVMSLADDLQWLSLVEVSWAALQQLLGRRRAGRFWSYFPTGLRHRSRPSRYRTIPVCDNATIQSYQNQSGFVPTWFVDGLPRCYPGLGPTQRKCMAIAARERSRQGQRYFVTAPLSVTGTNPTWFFSVAIPTLV